MKRFSVFSLFLIAAVLLISSLVLWSPLLYAHDLGTTFTITENTRGPVKFDLSGTSKYTIDSTDADSQKFEISAPIDQQGQELQFTSSNVPDYENPADADTDNDYEITLKYADRISPNDDPDAHTHDITVRVTNVAAPDKMSAPTLGTRPGGDVAVSWTAVSHAYLTGYEVHWANTGNTSDTDSGTVGKNSTSATIVALTIGDTYDIKVRALSSEGNSEWSDTTSIVPVLSTLDEEDPSGEDPSAQADAVPGLSGQEQLLLGSLLTYDTIIFNELHNGSDDATDWLELRNVSSVDIPIDNWQLMIQTGSDTTVIPFPAGTAISAGEVLLITNTQMTTAAVVVESFALPQTDFALILRSPIVFGDIAGNYFQTENERPETAPEFTVDTAWERVQAATSGYRAEAWAKSTHRNGHGSPGYQPPTVPGDLNHDGIVNIQDLVLVASQFGTTGPSAADLNADNTVNIQDLVLVANALDTVAAAPAAGQSTAALVNTWLQLAQQNAASSVQTSLPKGFSYARGIQVLEQLARALTPETTALFANYPNPFNPETWIPYQLAKAADVSVTIYASDGNVVRTLVLGHQEAGMYKNRTQAAYWDGKNEIGESVASGLYFYTLTAGDFTATRRMLILK